MIRYESMDSLNESMFLQISYTIPATLIFTNKLLGMRGGSIFLIFYNPNPNKPANLNTFILQEKLKFIIKNNILFHKRPSLESVE